MKLTVAMLLLLVVACSKAPAPERLSPRFSEVADLTRVRGSSRRIEAAQTLVKAHQDSFEMIARGTGAPLPLAVLDSELAQAIDLLFEAREAGEALPQGEPTAVLGLHQLTELLIETAPPGDAAQLELAVWLGSRIRDQRPGLLGAIVGGDVMAKAMARLDAAGVAPNARMRALGPASDMVRRVFAREALAVEAEVKTLLGRDDQENAIIRDGFGMWLALQERTMDAIEAQRASPSGMVVAAEAGCSEGQASDSELVVALVSGCGAWRDLESTRGAIADYLAKADAPEDAAGSAALTVRTSADALRAASSEPEPALVKVKQGVRVLGLASDHPFYALGLRNGDIVKRLDDDAASEIDLRAAIGRFADATGAHHIVGLRGSEPLHVTLVAAETDVPATARPTPNPIDDPMPEPPDTPRSESLHRIARARIADAKRLREELETSGLTLSWDDAAGAFVVGGVAAPSLAAELGLADGDQLRVLDGRRASLAHDEAQSGIGFLVDGLHGADVTAELTRAGATVTLRWHME